MKTLGKVMMGASVGALALTAFSGVKADAAVNFTHDKTLTGVVAGTKVSFDSVKAAKGGPDYNAKGKVDLYDAGATVNLSNLKTTKDSYIMVDDDVYKVNKDKQTKYKATCDGNFIKIFVNGTEITKPSEMDAYQWRTEAGDWNNFDADETKMEDTVDLTGCTMQGATIYLRYKGVSSGAVDAIISTPDSSEKVKIAGTEVTIKEIAADSFVSKEFKVKVPKKANAPAIKVDYVNGIVKKNPKVNGVIATGSGVTATVLGKVPSATAILANDLTLDLSDTGVIVALTPATEKKPASKLAVFEWKEDMIPETPTLTTTGAALDKSVYATEIASCTAISGDLATVSSAAVLKYSAPQGETFQIESVDKDHTYQIFEAGDDGKPKSTKPVATIKPVGKASFKSSKVSDSTSLVIRIAGDNKALTLPSEYSATFKPVYIPKPKKK